MIKPTAMVLGTFHMGGSSDLFNTEVNNLLGAKRQEEMRQCIERLKKFRPTKLAFEVVRERGDSLNEEYRRFLAGELTLEAWEVHQLGFRIAAELGHERIYAVDWMENTARYGCGDAYEWAAAKDPKLFSELWGTDNTERTHRPGDETTILDMLLDCNHPEEVKASHRLHLNIARIGVDEDYVGVGWLRWWYERNLIIFSNLTHLRENPEERILLLIGGAHVHLIEQFLKESGLFAVESAYTYLSDKL